MFNSIKRKLQLIITINILVILWVSVTAFYFSGRLSTDYRSTVDTLYYLNMLSDKASLANKNLEEYIQNSSSSRKQAYTENLTLAISYAKKVPDNLDDEEALVLTHGLENIINSYDETNRKIIDATMGNNLPFDLINESRRIYANISNRIIKITSLVITERSIKYENFVLRTQHYKIMFYVIMFISFIAIFLFGKYLLESFSKPINKLAKGAWEISKGNFSINDLKIKGNYEIEVLADAFNSMKNNIKQLIDEIKEKANIEAKLHEQELENLRITNLLNASELKSLQSQINPHFLYNTLNTISRIAYFNNDHKVVEMIDKIVNILRYNLKKIDRPVSLQEEIENLKNYIFIQNCRFKDKINFILNINTLHMNELIPCLTLQPIVENAIIHGLEPYGYGGNIKVDVYDSSDNHIIITISDDGVGMEQEVIASFTAETGDSHYEGHTTGIGMNNVISRLYYHYNKKNILNIKSEIGSGTTVMLKLPIKSGAVENV